MEKANNELKLNFEHNIFLQLIEKYGKTSQLFIAVEEMAELQKELSKCVRDKGNIDNLLEEMADVYIMLEQILLIYKIDNEKLQKEIIKKTEKAKSYL